MAGRSMAMTGMRAFFGGPDRAPRLLRDLLEERVEAVPAGGEIRWVTYYFRDEALALALIRARRRGVRVMLAAEARPRLRSANDRVRDRLEGKEGLGPGVRWVGHRLPVHLHEKLYYFSHPRPAALVGTFNPSGNVPEDPEVLREIGDQDRGHNLLVEIVQQRLVGALAEHAAAIHREAHGIRERFTPANNRALEGEGASVHFFPRRSTDLLIRLLCSVPRDGRLRIAASHIRDPAVVKVLCERARAGVPVEIVAHHTERRVPIRVETACRAAGVDFRRYVHPEGLPMHSKFVLAEDGEIRRAAFGSMNLTRTSRFLNHEVLVVSTEPDLYAALSERWESMASERWTGGEATHPGRMTVE